MTQNTAEDQKPENDETIESPIIDDSIGLNDTPESQAETAQDNDAIAQLTAERDDMRDKLMRALAEADNTRKRAERAQQDTQKYAVTGFAKDMLDIADNLRRALDAIPDDKQDDETVQLLYNGVAATEKIMLSTFEKHGITKIEPTEGKFDPNFHEVMFETEIAGKEGGEIIQLLEAGYKIHDRLLRPARVGVAKSDPNMMDYKIDEEV